MSESVLDSKKSLSIGERINKLQKSAKDKIKM